MVSYLIVRLLILTISLFTDPQVGILFLFSSIQGISFLVSASCSRYVGKNTTKFVSKNKEKALSG
jgi:hypothetical protein